MSLNSEFIASRHYCDGNQGPCYCHFVSWSLKHEMLVKDTNYHVTSVYHAKMNSWFESDECSINSYCDIDLTISS